MKGKSEILFQNQPLLLIRLILKKSLNINSPYFVSGFRWRLKPMSELDK